MSLNMLTDDMKPVCWFVKLRSQKVDRPKVMASSFHAFLLVSNGRGSPDTRAECRTKRLAVPRKKQVKMEANVLKLML